MDRELEVIRDDMEQTRASLADKLGALETQVRETVSGAAETVNSTVEGVKDVVHTVTDTVGSVTESLNIFKQIEQHPWAALGIALGVGCAAGYLLGGSSRPQFYPQPQAYRPPTPSPLPDLRPMGHEPARQTAYQPAPAPEPQKESGGILDSAASLLPSMDTVKQMLPDVGDIGNTVVSSLGGLAVGSVMSVVRELAYQALPEEWKGEVTKMVDQVTTQLGGKVQPRQEPSQPQQPQPAASEQKSDDKPGERDKGNGRGRQAPRGQLAYQG